MASTSNLVITPQPEPSVENVFAKETSYRLRWYILALPALACFILLIVYVAVSTQSCILYIDGVRNITLKTNQTNCSSIPIHSFNYPNHALEVRNVKTYTRSSGVLIAFGACLAFMLLLITPCNLGNYRTCHRRTTCCCKQTTLEEAINRYMIGYISDENHFQRVVQSGREGLDMIVAKLKYSIPEVSFDILLTGSLQERLGKPTVLKLKTMDSLPIKSLLSSDFDVMLTPQVVKAKRREDPNLGPTLFEVVTLPNMPTGFVWLRLNRNLQESRNPFWQNLCKEFTFEGGTTDVFLSCLEVRNIFVAGMKKIKRKEVGRFDWFKKVSDKGIDFHVQAQGPAVTVKIDSREGCCSEKRCPDVLRPTLFYGDFIFAIRCIGWPQEAEQWPLRQRYWPPPAVIQEILSYGYHVVPKPSFPMEYNKKKAKKLGKSALKNEWRLSYSLAEILLSKHIPPTARACLLALKGTFKRHRNKSIKAFSSYHLKTILFWALEQNPPDLWCPERIDECFMKLVDSLLECAKNKHCSHYFMPQMNLMSSLPITWANLHAMLNKMKEDPVSYVSSRNLRCLGNLAACWECCCYNHGDDSYIDIY